jgi:transcription termination factor Rho
MHQRTGEGGQSNQRSSSRRGRRGGRRKKAQGQGSGGQGGGAQGGGAKQGGGGRPRRRGRRSGGGNNSNNNANQPPKPVQGLLDLTRNGAGILRDRALARQEDPLIPVAQVRSLGLRQGDLVEGQARGRNVVQIDKVNGKEPEGLDQRIHFDRLTAVHPDVPIVLGGTPDAITGRLLDIISPVGRGQRGLIVAPPKAGKTTVLTNIAEGVSRNKGLYLIACLVGERPEEVTEIRRAVDGLVLAADLDAPAADHTRVAELAIEHAKRICESGGHAVVLLDSLTRLARAYNLSLKGGGRTLSGGLDAMALQPVRKIFGAARSSEEAGSVTILATCLVETGSKLDDVVYEEFKGTGNMEVYLDRKLAQRRLYPAIDINRSGTRREELLLDAQTMRQVTALRRKLAGVPSDKALSALLLALKRQIELEATEV